MDGATPKFNAALSTTVVSLKAVPGQVTAYEFYNAGNALAYVQFFDAKAADVTLGTTVPVWIVPVAAGARAVGPHDKLRFLTAISVAAATTATGSTAPNAAQVAAIGVR